MKDRNRRQFHRIDYNNDAIVEFADTSYTRCQIQNLSLSGMFIAGNFNNSQSKECLVSFVRENGERSETFIEALGQVVRENGEGIGVKITTMQFDHYMRLVTELINNAEKPVIILSEIPKWCPYEIADEKLNVLQ